MSSKGRARWGYLNFGPSQPIFVNTQNQLKQAFLSFIFYNDIFCLKITTNVFMGFLLLVTCIVVWTSQTLTRQKINLDNVFYAVKRFRNLGQQWEIDWVFHLSPIDSNTSCFFAPSSPILTQLLFCPLSEVFAFYVSTQWWMLWGCWCVFRVRLSLFLVSSEHDRWANVYLITVIIET